MNASVTHINIRRAIPEDASALAALALQTFMETYAAENDANNMRMHCEQYFGEEQQLAEIIHSQYAVLLAYVDTQLAGFAFIKKSPTPACIDEVNAICLSRFYVLKKWHGKGIAAALMSEVIQVVKTLGGQHIWLTMWEHNQRAQAYYTKVGFTKKGFAKFNFGTEVQIDHVFIKPV